MRKTRKVLSVILATLFLVVALSSFCLAADKKLSVPSPAKNMNVVQSPGTNFAICVDPAVKNFNVTKTLSGNVATFTMSGQICNNGPGDWNKPDNALEANFAVYNGYSPQFSYAAGGNPKFFKQTVGPVLKKNQCMSFTQTYTRDKILQWGFSNNTATQRQMKLMFEFYVRDAKGLIGVGAQPKALDCNLDNNLLSKTFEMMISMP
jgi:hypothetical protein